MSRQKRQAGAWEVRRTLAVPALTHAADAAAVEKALRELPGLLEIHADRRHRTVQVHYDITACDYGTVENTLAAAGFPVPQTLWTRLKANWYQYLDTTGRDNAATPTPPCCNRPPKR
jgi:copper chaperone CopZ